MNLSRLIGCNALPPEDAVPKNPIPALKKKHFGFYTSIFCKVLALIVGQNPFSRRKNLSNTGDTPPLPKRRNGRELGALVTTSHLFWPNQRRNAAFSLRFWLSNSIVPVENVTTQWPGGRGSDAKMWPKALIEKPLRKFCLMGPLAMFCSFKKSAGLWILLAGLPRRRWQVTLCVSTV